MMDVDVSELAARDAVQQLIYRYSIAVTRADYAEMARLFTPDAVWDGAAFGRFETAREFIDYIAAGSTTLSVLIQAPSAPVVEIIDSDRAEATTNIHEVLRGTNANDGPLGVAGSAVVVDQYGIYFDKISRQDGDWKFTHRTFVPLLIEAGGQMGSVVTSRPVDQPA
jgi:ketosteroid isomerase-like protein